MASADLPNPGPLTDEQRALVKSTAPVLAEHGQTITRRFYAQMLDAHPELKSVFSHSKQASGQQADALARAVHAYAAHIDDLAPLLPAVERICQKHASLHITPDQYAIVGEHLLQAIEDVLGADVFSPAGALYAAWAAAYWQLAHIFIKREEELYAQAAWVGWRKFALRERVKESDEITSFYLVPEDELPLPRWQPGQYISVRMHVPELGEFQARQYSLSDAPHPAHFRISVKRERGTSAAHTGTVSNLLHDTLHAGGALDVAFPFGEFVLDASPAPAVLVSAGVGLTPLLAMLGALVGTPPAADAVAGEGTRKVSWIHGARSPATHAFGARVRALRAAHPAQLRTTLYYSQPAPSVAVAVADTPPGADTTDSDADAILHGRLDLARVDAAALFLDDAGAQYYVCGPEAFMADAVRALQARGIDGARIHAEVFGGGAVPV